MKKDDKKQLINCEVSSCMHHESDDTCNLREIEIEKQCGCSSCECKEDTLCSSYEEKEEK